MLVKLWRVGRGWRSKSVNTWQSQRAGIYPRVMVSGWSLVLPCLPEVLAYFKRPGAHTSPTTRTRESGARLECPLSILGSSDQPPRLHFPDSSHDCAGAGKHPPTQTPAPHPSAWRASPTAPGAPGQESARTRPPAPPPAHSPNSYGRSKERVGARHAGACRNPAARGAREDALRAPQRLLLTRPPTATSRGAPMLEKNGTPEKVRS